MAKCKHKIVKCCGCGEIIDRQDSLEKEFYSDGKNWTIEENPFSELDDLEIEDILKGLGVKWS